jgi:hypothetical protein
MANSITTFDDLDTLFANYIQNTLNLDADKVLISYQTRGKIASDISDTVVYIHTEQYYEDQTQYKQRREVYNSATNKVDVYQQTMRTLSLDIVFYGPQSAELATLLNELIYFDSSKQFFSNNNLALIPDGTTLTLHIHEIINGEWWDRCDLKLRFYNSIETTDAVNAIDSVDVNMNDIEFIIS